MTNAQTTQKEALNPNVGIGVWDNREQRKFEKTAAVVSAWFAENVVFKPDQGETMADLYNNYRAKALLLEKTSVLLKARVFAHVLKRNLSKEIEDLQVIFAYKGESRVEGVQLRKDTDL